MALVLHVLRPDDVFVDIGANVGSYTILGGGAAGADCISIEPIPSTFGMATTEHRNQSPERARTGAEYRTGTGGGRPAFYRRAQHREPRAR